MTDTVYVTKGGRRWHADPECKALDSGRMLWDSDEGDGPHYIRKLSAAEVADRAPCLVCAGQPGRSEWVLTPENLGELVELIEWSKLHWGPAPSGSSHPTAIDGLTIWPHADRPRTWARFGDTIRRDGQRWTVASPNGEAR